MGSIILSMEAVLVGESINAIFVIIQILRMETKKKKKNSERLERMS